MEIICIFAELSNTRFFIRSSYGLALEGGVRAQNQTWTLNNPHFFQLLYEKL